MRHWSIVSSLFFVLLSSAAAGHATVAVEPVVPWVGALVTVRVLPDGDPTCLHWTASARNDFTITLVGTPLPPLTACLPEGQVVDVGSVDEAGRYHVEARREDGSVWGEAYFRVTQVPTFVDTDEAEIRPARPTTGDPVDVVLSLAENPPCYGILGVHDVAIAGDTITLTMIESNLAFECPPSPARAHGFVVHLPPLTAGLKTLIASYTTFNGVLERHFSVAEANAAVRLLDRFDARLTWTDPQGAQHDARPERLSNGSATFSFSDPANVELTVKALDGRPVNGNFWIFAASLTDQPWELHVVDRGSVNCGFTQCDERVYKGIAHQNANVLDTRAFEDCPICAP